MNARLKNALASSAIAAAALLGAASPAHAIVYVGNFDPAFGAPFTDLGWRGRAEFVLPDACAGKTGPFLNETSLACGSSQFKMQNASVEFYSLADKNKVPETVETLNFGSSARVESITLNTPIGAAFPTKLTGVTTTYSAAQRGTSVQAGNYSFNFYLKFDGGVASMAYSSADSDLDCKRSTEGCGFSNKDFPARVIFNQVGVVPEPETYALMLAGLGALGLCVRRRSKT